MTFQLVNENGSIVAKDPETGETQPVSIESLEAEDINNTIRYATPDDVQTVVDEAESIGGGTVIVTEGGDYDNPIEQPSNVAVIGTSPPSSKEIENGTTLTATNAAPLVILRDADGNTQPADRTGGVFGAELSRLRFDGGGVATSGLRLFGMQYSRFSNVLVEGVDGGTLDLSGESFTPGGTFYNVFETVRGRDSERGLVCRDNGRAVNANDFWGFQFSGNQKEGIDVENCNSNTFVGSVEQNLNDSGYDPTTRGTDDDPVGRVELAVRNGASDNWFHVHVENNNNDKATYFGDGTERNELHGRVTGSFSKPQYLFGDVDTANPIYPSMRFQAKSANPSTAFYPSGTANKPASAITQNESGRPTKITHTEDADGVYTGVGVEVLDFDGSSSTADDTIHAYTMFTGST